ncbi:PAS domain S-box protein [Desulfobulbus propionicus]
MTTTSILFPLDIQADCPEGEHKYRLAFLPQDVRTLSVLISFALVSNLVLVRLDFLVLNNQPLFTVMLTLHLVFCLFSVAILAVIQRLHDAGLFDRWALMWAISWVLFILLANFTRPSLYGGHIIALDLSAVLALYIIQPGPVLWRVLPPIMLSLGNLLLLLTMDTSLDAATRTLLPMGYTAANAVSWLVSANWYRYRKCSFTAHRALERLYLEAEQRRREAEASEKAWERIFDTSPNMLMVIDNDHRITRLNKTLAKRFGLTREAALGRRCCDLLCGVTEPQKQCSLRTICTSATNGMEAYFPVLGVDVHLLAVPLPDQAENSTATVIIIRDISDWKRTELALNTAREQYRSLVENSHGIIYTITPRGYVTYVSPGYSNLLGFESEHVVGKHFREIVHPEDVALCEAFQEEVLESGEVRHGLEYRVFHRDGSVRWHLSNFIPRRDGQGQVKSYVGNSVDITEQKLHQAELKASREAAEEASRAKSDFLALISHEIRTPLTAIAGFIGLARRTTDPEQLGQYLDILDQSAHLLMDMVNDMLDMSKMEAGQLTMDVIPFNLPETLQLLRWQFTAVAEKKTGVELDVQTSPDLPSWILGDPSRLRQILSNLLSNALKFTEIGSVTLKVYGEAHEQGAEPCRLVFAVEDTGIGIDPGRQELLFQPFQQIEPGITRKYGGTGLGLAIVRRLVELMGGRIEVRSGLGQGSTFTVRLPCRPCPPARYERIVASPARPLSVLVVEDNGFNRLLLQETLGGWGHWVQSVDNAVDALNMVNEQRFDCIILDVWMPGLDGLEFSVRLRRLETLSNLEPTPIIAYTADTDDRIRQRASDAGIQAVLCKPLDPQLLHLILGQHCRAFHSMPVGGTATKQSGNTVVVPINHDLDSRVIAGMGQDQERIAIYAQLLWDDIATELERLDQALLVEDRPWIFEASHSLKGLCGYLRDKHAGALALRIHKGAMDLPFPELNDLVKQLHSAAIRPAASGTDEP